MKVRLLTNIHEYNMPITPFNPKAPTTPQTGGIKSWKPGQELPTPPPAPKENLGQQVGDEQLAGVNKIKGSIEKGASDIQKGMEKGGLKGVPDVALGMAKSAFGTISGAGQAVLAPVNVLVSKLTNAVTPMLRQQNPELAKAYDAIIPTVQSLADKHPESATLIGDMVNSLLLGVGGGVAEAPTKEAIGEAFTSKALKGAGEDIVNVGKNALEKGKAKIAETPKIGDVLAGKEATYKASKISAPETKQFIPKEQGGGGKTFGSVVDNTEKAIKQFKEKSIKTLNDVKSKITGTNFKQPDVANVINEKLTSVLGNKAESRGLKGFDATSASVKDLKDYGLITDKEESLVNGMVKTLQNNPDISDRGILNLKEDLYKKYYKAGNQDYATSNKIVKSIYDGLNDLVGSANKNLKPALDLSSKNIADVESMNKQLLGTGAEREAKLKSIATHLKDGTVNADDIKLIQQLEKETGTKILPDLQGYSNYSELLAEKNKTGKFPTAKGVKSKAIKGTLKKGAIGLGITGGVLEGAKIITGN
jgi:hypothetical protein